MSRSSPNILITGTPGVGKSSLCEMLAERTGLEWLEVSQMAKDNDCLLEYDQELKCHVIDEDKLMDDMEDMMVEGGKIVDYHGSSFFPERWFDIVFVLRTSNTVLYDRLQKRGYNEKKIKNNIECEIFNVISDETYDSYEKEIVHQLQSNSMEELEDNLEKITSWINDWKKNHS